MIDNAREGILYREVLLGDDYEAVPCEKLNPKEYLMFEVNDLIRMR